jgi:acetyl-CoA carboxylase biotin carboxyl carrier protein
MDVNEMKELLELMEVHQLMEIELQDGQKRIRLRKFEQKNTALESVPVLPNVSQPGPGEPVSSDNLVEFKSPLVGTFYRAPKPDAEPFVNIGDEVNPESILCIIEAMKVMNEIKAEMHGIIREILVKNAQAVEFGETLFKIERK